MPITNSIRSLDFILYCNHMFTESLGTQKTYPCLWYSPVYAGENMAYYQIIDLFVKWAIDIYTRRDIPACERHAVFYKYIQ